MRPGTIPTVLLAAAGLLAAVATLYAVTHDVSCQGVDPGTGAHSGGYDGAGNQIVFGGGGLAVLLAFAAAIGFVVSRGRLRGRTVAAGAAASLATAALAGTVWLFAGLASAFACGFF